MVCLPVRCPTLMRAIACACVLLGAVFTSADEEPAGPRRYALLVGCSHYPVLEKLLGKERYEAQVRLRGPENDVRLWRQVLTRNLGFALRDVVTLAGWSDDAPEGNPTLAAIRGHLDRLAASVKPGDRVVIVMAGHGTQLPDDGDDELDGKDEVFLPADAAVWKAADGGIPAALRDDEIGRRVRGIRDQGAMVWLVMDCCHAGTMVRGGSGRSRYLSGDSLGIPDVPGPRARGVDAGVCRERMESLENVVAFYGARSHGKAREMRLPRNAKPRSPVHGLLSWTLASQIARLGGGMTFDELYRRVVATYRAIPYLETRPLVEGDVRRVVGEEGHGTLMGIHQSLHVHPKRNRPLPALDAGTLTGIEPGTVLSIHEPESDRLLGYVQATDVGPHRAWCETVERDGLRLEPLRGPTDVRTAKIVERPVGGYALSIAVVDVNGRLLTRDALPDEDRRFLETEAARRKYPAVTDRDDADWLLVVGEDGTHVRPAAGAGDVAFALSPGEVRSTLGRIFRAQNLMRVARREDVRPPSSRLIVEMRTVTSFGEILEGSDCTLQPGDRAKLVIRNGTGRAHDLWVFLLDADFGVTVLHPPADRTPRLEAEDTENQEIGITVTDETLGTERVIVIAFPASAGPEWPNLTWLRQEPLARELGGRDRVGASGGAFGDLLEELAYGDELGAGRARARAPRALGGETAPAMKVIRVRTAWPETRARPELLGPRAGVSPPQPSGATDDVPDPWRIGPFAALAKTWPGASGFDALLGGETVAAQILLDLDSEGLSAPDGSSAVKKILMDRAFDAEAAFHFDGDRRTAFYDSDNDGVFDLILVDHDDDPEADVRYTLDGGAWHRDPDVHVPWLATSHMPWIRGTEQRLAVIRKLRYLTR